MTISKAIERADELRPNPFEEEQKFRWLSELDGKIAREIMEDKSFKSYDYSSDSEKELLAAEAYCDIYLFYLAAMYDFFSRDYGEYNNSMLMFNEAYSKYAKACQNGSVDISTAASDGSGSVGGVRGQYYKNIF